jgi:Holliday junction resolvasome RuvABC endonuclease subunit
VIIAGLDISLTGFGAVAVPSSWDLDWRRVARISFGRPLAKGASTREATARLRDIARDVRVWLIRVGASHVVAEDLPPHANGFSMVPLAELRGVLRLELLDQAGLDLQFVNQSTARKLLLGKLPAKERKQHVVEALRAAGADFDDADQADAFCTVNALLDDFEIPSLRNLLWQPEPKRTKRRRVA